MHSSIGTIDSNSSRTGMTRLLKLIIVTSIASVPVLGQGNAYSIDNFDMRNGVRVYAQPASSPKRSNRKAKGGGQAVLANAGDAGQGNTPKTPSDSVRPLVQQTSIIYPNTNPRGTVGTTLRGFTTGNSQVDQYLIDSGTRHGVDPLLLYSIMHQESTFKLRAISPKGARGLMQLMPPTAIRYGVANIFDPRQNIEGGARYMAFLLEHFDNDLSLALAGYNAGERAVEKYGWRIPPYSETQEYVRRITRRYALLRDPNAALYAPQLNKIQTAALKDRQSQPLSIYERSVFTVRLPDGRLELMSQ